MRVESRKAGKKTSREERTFSLSECAIIHLAQTEMENIESRFGKCENAIARVKKHNIWMVC